MRVWARGVRVWSSDDSEAQRGGMYVVWMYRWMDGYNDACVWECVWCRAAIGRRLQKEGRVQRSTANRQANRSMERVSRAFGNGCLGQRCDGFKSGRLGRAIGRPGRPGSVGDCGGSHSYAD